MEAQVIDQRVTYLFNQGLTQPEIALCLAIDGVQISVRHLRRLLARLQLYRRRNLTDPEVLVNFIAEQLRGPGRLHGYRMMTERCRSAGLRVTRNLVREVQSSLDPEGVAQRRARRLRRRFYSVPGPNFMWHMDSYDKLSPFGIGINGCIDGFSRYIIWMQANYTNSKPEVIAAYFVNAVNEQGGCPKIIRSDFGTENVVVNRLQHFLREDGNGAVHGPCVLQGRSTANQRIESWWGIYRRQNADFWRDLFLEFQSAGDFNGDVIDKGLIQFCFLDVIQVDQDVIKIMDEEALSKYIPHFGDRVFAKNWTGSSTAEEGRQSERKKRLIERIRAKMKVPGSNQVATAAFSVGSGSEHKSALKKSRKLELGWMHFQESNFRQVRRPCGGGTREIIVKNSDPVEKVLVDGKNIFFPNGKSPKGPLEDFTFTVRLTGSDEPLDEKLTIGELYDRTFQKNLRLYICSKKKSRPAQNQTLPRNPNTNTCHCSRSFPPTDEPLLSSTPVMHNTSSPHLSGLPVPENLSTSIDDEVIVFGDGGNILVDALCDTLIYPPLQANHGASDIIEIVDISLANIHNLLEINIESNPAAGAQSQPQPGSQAQSQPGSSVQSQPGTQGQPQPGSQTQSQPGSQVQSQPGTQSQPQPGSQTQSQPGSQVQSQPGSQTQPQPGTQSQPQPGSQAQPQSSSQTQPQPDISDDSEDFFGDPENVVEKHIIVVRKTHTVSDMIAAFSQENILEASLGFRRVLENGYFEKGVGSGIAMDCVTDFWSNFYDTKTSGTTYKIPDLHHTMQEREWKAVAKIVAYGWQRFKYLPVQLAPPFLKEAFSLTEENCSLMEAFFHYIGSTEKDVLVEALNDFKEADTEELLSILSSHNCSVMPNKENLSRLLEEIAHKELVQQPSFIIKCWKPILKGVGESLGNGGLDKILSDLQPKARNITKSIKFPSSMSPEERSTSLHLQRFIREMDGKELGMFLRYCTGSDLFLSKTIKIYFTNMPEFVRRPVAHTCTCVLELSCNYGTYSEFRSEFLSVLQSGIWIMDMA